MRTLPASADHDVEISPEQRLELFSRAVEPTLQRDFKHKGATNGDGSYSAELIGYVEIVP